MINTDKLKRNGKIYMLAYDQGLEHGPSDFNDYNYHPNYILKTAMNGNASCVTMQYGLAKQFYNSELKKKLPLILKINGKSKLFSGNLQYAQTASVADAKAIGAVGVGFTINPGQVNEHLAYEQFAQIRRDAEKAGLLTVIWSYARGPEVKDQFSPEIISYATRVAAELGADVVKVKYSGDPVSFSKAVRMALKTEVVASGTDNFGKNYVEDVVKMLDSGAAGIAVGRKVWQHKDPINFSKKLASAIYNHQFSAK